MVVVTAGNRGQDRWSWVINPGLPLLGMALYLAAAWWRSGSLGYPLDDAWIHQTYARSLALSGEMAFNPGELSAGSTSPLWTALLAPGHWLGAPLPWSYALGLASMVLCGWLTWRLARRLFPTLPGVPWLATGTVVLEWHLAWAAASGMETLLFTAASLGLVELYLATRTAGGRLLPAAWGLLGGLLYLLRPEGALLVGLVGVDLLRSGPRTRRLRAGLLLGTAWLVTVAPGLFVNWQATGSLLPDTLAAKLVYAANAGLLGRLVFVPLAGLAFWAGSMLVILPASLWGSARALRSDPSLHWLPLAWPLALVLLFAWRLPVLYHHARYLMPALPWAILYGAAGLLGVRAPGRRRFLVLLHGLVLLVFWFQGASTYSWNVDNIQDMQVTIGHWLARATPSEAVVAASDVGAIGYFGGRRVLDLEGLITPEINDLRRAGQSPAPFLQEQGTGYMVLYRGGDTLWQNQLAMTPAFSVSLELNTISATDQMTVYRLERRAP